MKTTISFAFDDEEERRMQTILKAEDYRDALHDFWQDVLRPVTKHGIGCEDDEAKWQHYDDIKDALFRILREYDLDI